MRVKWISALLPMLLLLTWGVSLADEVRLRNGDRLSGRVLRLEAGLLVMETPYAGEISVKWEAVSGLQTDAPIRVVLGDGAVLSGIAGQSAAGRATLKPEGIPETLTLELARVAAINPPPPEPELKVRGRANVGANMTKGNTDTKTVYADAELVARTRENRFTLGGVYSRDEDRGERTSDALLGYMKYDHFLTPAWFFYAALSGLKDRFKDLNLRTVAGLGVGYQVWDAPLRSLSLEAGLSYVNEDFIVTADEGYAAGRWAVNFEHWLFAKRTQFFHFHEGLVGLEDTNDVFISSRTGLRFPLLERFNATVQFNYDWDNSPPAGTRKGDENYIFTLGYAF